MTQPRIYPTASSGRSFFTPFFCKNSTRSSIRPTRAKKKQNSTNAAASMPITVSISGSQKSICWFENDWIPAKGISTLFTCLPVHETKKALLSRTSEPEDVGLLYVSWILAICDLKWPTICSIWAHTQSTRSSTIDTGKNHEPIDTHWRSWSSIPWLIWCMADWVRGNEGTDILWLIYYNV